MGENHGEKRIIGCVETIIVKGTKKSKKVIAIIDTGATYTSIDKKIADEIGFEKIKRHIKIKSKSSADEFMRRPVIDTTIELKGSSFDVEANIEDRANMTCPVIIGRNILFKNFLVDVEKNDGLFREIYEKKFNKKKKW
ncbi:MAG: hypothetical protein DRN66_00535 [Candidatus Nanohalarchaeota archaeon]|nr:MAG: hypothetical protein DRN66_00535 [Candidatus Nanohaloarchaeota archaeon]